MVVVVPVSTVLVVAIVFTIIVPAIPFMPFITFVPVITPVSTISRPRGYTGGEECHRCKNEEKEHEFEYFTCSCVFGWAFMVEGICRVCIS